jgi:hypothetical protein
MAKAVSKTGKGGKSKTNVAARSEAKGKVRLCIYCGQPVGVRMTLVGGRRKMIRTCCGKATKAHT